MQGEVNMETPRVHHVSPPSLLARADGVIE
jgi:hypothetical protein